MHRDPPVMIAALSAISSRLSQTIGYTHYMKMNFGIKHDLRNPAEWRRSPRECTSLLREAAAERGTSLVVNLSSLAAKRPPVGLALYAATKSAVLAYTPAMNQELGGDGIKSVAISPSFVATGAQGAIPPEKMVQPLALRP